MKLFTLGAGKIETFLFLHREIIKILDVVFTGYKTGEHRFLQPDRYLFSGRYEVLLDRYSKLFNDQDVVENIERKHLAITNINNFDSLTEEFDLNIESWNASRNRWLDEKAQIEAIMPDDEYVEKDIKLAVYELQKSLPEYQKQKEVYLESLIEPKEPEAKKQKDNDVSIDPIKSKLYLYGEDIDIQVNSQEFLFLSALLAKPDERILWKEHAQIIGLGIVNYIDEDIARLVQDMKTKLRVKLRELGVNKRKITKLCTHIRAVRKAGYMFKSLR